MSQHAGATNINDLDDTEVDQVMQDLDDLINDSEPVGDEVNISRGGNGPSSNVMKNGIHALIIFILVVVFSNRYTLQTILKIPFLMKFEHHIWIPLMIIATLISLSYFGIQFLI